MNKKKNINILAICLIIIGAVIVAFGLITNFINKNKTPNTESKKDTAESILSKLSIDKYLSLALTSYIDLDTNILDINSDQNMMLYFYSNSDIKHYKIEISSDLGDKIKFVYVRYDDYINQHKKLFGVEPTLTIETTDVSFSNLVHVSKDDYKVDSSNLTTCDENKPNECYIMLNEYIDNSNSLEFSNLTMKNNIINGNIKLRKKGDMFLDATFEFVYEKNGDNYIIKSLKINSISSLLNNF